jgi:SAM-dependent methyltransferase
VTILSVPGEIWSLLKTLLRPMAPRRFHCCPVCGYRGPFGVVRNRPHARCPCCASLERHRFIYYVLDTEFESRIWGKPPLVVAPESAILRLLKRRFRTVITTDLSQAKVSVLADLQRLPFVSECFDIVIALHVLDEVTDDRIALSECFRVLAPGGWMIAPLPLISGSATLELTKRRLDGKIRLAGLDYWERFHDAGFRQYKKFVASAFPDPCNRYQFLVFEYGEEPVAEEFMIFVKG